MGFTVLRVFSFGFGMGLGLKGLRVSGLGRGGGSGLRPSALRLGFQGFRVWGFKVFQVLLNLWGLMDICV